MCAGQLLLYPEAEQNAREGKERYDRSETHGSGQTVCGGANGMHHKAETTQKTREASRTNAGLTGFLCWGE